MKAKLYCRAARVSQRNYPHQRVHIETNVKESFNSLPNALGPTVFFTVEIDVPDKLLYYGSPVVTIEIDAEQTHIVGKQGSVALAAAEEQE